MTTFIAMQSKFIYEVTGIYNEKQVDAGRNSFFFNFRTNERFYIY